MPACVVGFSVLYMSVFAVVGVSLVCSRCPEAGDVTVTLEMQCLVSLVHYQSVVLEGNLTENIRPEVCT